MPHTHLRSFYLVGLLLISIPLAWLPSAQAQTSWEVTPYDIEVCFALDAVPELQAHALLRLQTAITQGASVLVGPAWTVSSAVVPEILTQACLYRLDELSVADVEKCYASCLERDKVYFVAIRSNGFGFELNVRELDCCARMWARSVSRQVGHSDHLPTAVVDAVVDAFSPLAQIGKSVDEDDRPGVPKKKFIVRFRAGALVNRKDSPVLVAPDVVLQPVLRRNDRLGRPKPGGVKPVPWTYLTLLEGTGSERIANVHSGKRSPISGRISRRVDRLALAVHPSSLPTRLYLRARDAQQRALAGYEIYSRKPEQDLSEPSEFVGRSDLNGKIDIPQSDRPLRILYVKNGGELLARLPILPGLYPEQTVSMFDDRLRLEAEGFVRGLQGNLVDRVVEREILVARIRRRIEAGKIDEARSLLAELRSLRLPSHLAMDLANARQELIIKANARTQAKINDVFADTEKQLREYEDARDVEQLTVELNAAAQAPSGTREP
ncbi:MAG: hypothetical protein MK179_19630 [Pirellulaceae bacterium]|nr:hypothetical protein [Pirellulaceae bacterium]